MGISDVFKPLAPASGDPVDHEPSTYASILLAVIVASTVGTYVLGLSLAAHGLDYIVSSIPFFFLMMATEALLLQAGAVKDSVAARYSSCDTWASITSGTMQIVGLTFVRRFFSHAVLYAWVYNTYHVTDLSQASWSVWIACFVASDFAYYWFHRHAHELAPLWAGHNVHHSSEHYNLSTALRQSWRQALLSPIWSLPFALCLPPREFFIASQWVTIYQFWIHTCVIRRLGFLEYIFNTPSHHRCHHDRRLHKNFAGVFIIWDRLFGTFQDELKLYDDPSVTKEQRVRGEAMFFGIQEVVNTWTEASLQLMLVLQMRSWWVGPGFSTSTADRPLPKYCPDMPRFRLKESFSLLSKLYVWSQYIMFTALFGVLVSDQPKWPFWQDAVKLTAFIVVSMTTQGMLMDGGNIAWLLEMSRCVVGVLLFESWGWYVLSWFHVASLVTCLFNKHRLLGLADAADDQKKIQ